MEKRMFDRLKKAAAFTLALSALALAACQPTPEEEVVVNKGDGLLEDAIGQTGGDTPAQPYYAPERLEMAVDGLPGNYSIDFDAGVDIPNQTEWPVYSVELTKFTQTQADAARLALLGSAVLYRPGESRSRAEIQQSIDYYENELSLCKGDETQLLEAYTEILRELYIEYESTPEDLVLQEADTNFKFMEERVAAGRYGGRQVMLSEDSYRIEWTDEARQRAIAAGCESIYGVCWTDSGRKMELAVENGEGSSHLYYQIAEGNLLADPGVSYPLDEAIQRADALLKEAGLDFTLVEARTEADIYGNMGEEESPYYHALVYKRNIAGAAMDGITSIIEQGDGTDEARNAGGEFRNDVPEQETIRLYLDDYGVRLFTWSQPLKVSALENPNVTLLPFDKISERIAAQLKMQTIWDAGAWGYEEEWIDGRRLAIHKIALSYLIVAKSGDMSSYYLMPVWNVCGDMYYHYINSYPTGESNTFILDENNERLVWRSRYDTRDYSILTLNAIDGSVIDRSRGY